MEQLKVCPFCGGEGYTFNEGPWWYVQCEGRGGERDDCPLYIDEAYESKAEAIEAWNRRA